MPDKPGQWGAASTLGFEIGSALAVLCDRTERTHAALGVLGLPFRADSESVGFKQVLRVPSELQFLVR